MSSFIEELYVRVAIGEVPWMWRGAPETPQAFHDLIWSDVLVQFAIESLHDAEPVGLVTAYNSNLFHRFCHLRVVVPSQHRESPGPLEGTVVFLNYLFAKFGLRNVYAEVTGMGLGGFQSAEGALFSPVGTFEDRLVAQGGFDDLHLFSMSRAQWIEKGLPLFERATGHLSGFDGHDHVADASG